MVDISKCAGVKCDVKNKCYRYTSICSQFQSYLNPNNINPCEYFINNEGKSNESKKTNYNKSIDRNKISMSGISAEEIKNNV